MNKTIAACFSKGMLKISNLGVFYPELDIGNDINHRNTAQAVVGWGFKSTAKKARDYARHHGLPYIALEDGFLRSVGLGVNGAPPASLIMDNEGIYYDSRQPSRLESLIVDSNALTSAELARASSCIGAIKQYRLSKYNSNTLSALESKPKIVVIDQTQGDASVEGAQADASTFVRMLEDALNLHPNDDVWLKVHPDVLAGKKKGFLYPVPVENSRIRVCSESVNPWDFLESVSDLYTVSSLMGFEALLGSVSVHCYGLPFYAGWGLTNDKQSCSRRGLSRTLEQVFYAAYIQYSRYVDPVLGIQCELEDIINLFSDILNKVSLQSLYVNHSHLSFVRNFLIRPYLNLWQLMDSKHSDVSILWGKKQATDAIEWRIEDGFIRSCGLGVQLSKPASLVLDKSGIYFDSTQVSDLESFYNRIQLTEWENVRASRLIKLLRESKVTKYNVGTQGSLILPCVQRILLVPGQVESDASIRYGSEKIKTNDELLELVRNENPDAFIIYKPHPDVIAGERDKSVTISHAFADMVVNNIDMDYLLEVVDEVHTMTSLTGFEALLRSKQVYTYGMPFYAGWGLTIDREFCSRRTRTLSLEELVYGSLIYYPTYIDTFTNMACTVEQTIQRIHQQREGNISVNFSLYLFILLQIRRLRDRIR
ncbi:capsule biosynthesis protein [Vibrio sp. 10N.286.49.B3]|uniref:capsular polysaccharide biosynthesis protein n=1 Tax=Vibrio sp. 10N.286.49.B3 TaxID=1880855 RepID=UPI000C83445C|nr:capsular polysaccharide biosynthesis protein [Vibrio sp. 10N.286.49.B3]PMH42163.1 capsule biosynthesis protein [Vibrio sp. 10N.286.49.B3]